MLLGRPSPALVYGIARSRSIVLLIGALAVLSALAPPPASAQSARERALSLFEDSAVAYREGRFSEAAAALGQAYELFPEPVLLYNLARALEADGQLEAARDAYEDFLEESPDAEQAAPSRARLEVIARLISERDALREAAETRPPPDPQATEPAPRAPPEPTPSASGPDTTAPWLVLVSSAAVAVTGAVLLGVASARYDAAATEPVHASAASMEREAYVLRDAGAALLAIGGVAMSASIVWLIVASAEGSSESVAFGLSPSAASLRVAF